MSLFLKVESNLNKDTELDALRRYFIASEKRRRIGTGEYKPRPTYAENVIVCNELQVELDRQASEIGDQTNLLNFQNESAVSH